MANNAVRLIAPVLLGALILLFPADGLRALGLGEARVDSWLGQPLDVSIRLLEVESEAIESVSVGPASLEDYERLGVPSESLGLGLEVTVDRRADPPVVRVRSQRPVDDPIVQILIDARWSSGRVLREYTLFLDPPVMESAAPVRRVDEPAAETRPEPAETPRRETRRQPAEAAEPSTRPARQPSEPASEPAADPGPASRGADSVTVSQGDTLWSLAQAWRPDSSLSMDQVMLAIFNRNRDAFLGENINRLRSDAVLDMPAVDEVRSVDRAEAERRVREHMRSWQPAVAEDVPVVSDAAMPESPEPAASETGADEAGEAASESAQADEDFRLDVVPPEEDQYSETSAVSESEIERVSEQLAQVEEEIAAEGLENEAFDEHVAEVRDALDQRDMAGLAVAEESLAELEARLREAREARAEQERLAQSADGEAATDSEEGDQIADYMRELEEEFGTQEGEEAADDEEQVAMADSGDDAGMDTAAEDGASDEAEATADEAAEGSDEAEPAEQAATPMTVTRTSNGGLPGWLWPAVGILVLALLVAGGLWWVRRKRGEGLAGEESLAAGDAVDAARASVARDPGDLAAHLALLKLLADRGREREFTDAFDEMYQEVDDESAPEWQEALSLAAAHVPDHPLLTPREESVDDDFDRRADEMLGMLDVGDDESEEASEPESERAEAASDRPESRADDDFDLGLEDDDEAAPSFGRRERDESDDREDTFDEDMDLAVLSERLDDPSKEPGRDKSFEKDDPDADFGEFKEVDEDEYSVGDAVEEEPDEHSEAPVDLERDEAAEPDLDFDTSREQEADEVFGEAGTRDTEALDLELSSDVEDLDSEVSDRGLDFDLGDTGESESPVTGVGDTDASSDEGIDAEPGAFDLDEAEEAEVPELAEAEDEEKSEAPSGAAGGSLSDEDADVKLDLARAYISVDLADSARAVLEEVVSDGSEEKRAEAQKLLDDMD
jgi:pilus assembly protein FimV